MIELEHMELARKVIRYCRELAQFTEEPGRTTRTFLSPPMHQVHRHLGAWMREFGMSVTVDAAGNLRALSPGTTPTRLLIASHLDTVPNAGPFDGILGVVIGVALVEALQSRADRPTIEVIGFSEEEGVRFGVPFIGSRAVTGTLGEPAPPVFDAICEAIRHFGLDPAALPDARLAPDTTACLEIHIEQGPVLESLDLPLGVVNSIAGQSRYSFTFQGNANHAGTTPMYLRNDALTAAAEWICLVETLATHTPGLVATTGSIYVEPNATNVIPALARVSLDVRHSVDKTRIDAVARLIASAHSICQRRGIALNHEQRLDQPAVAMDVGLTRTLEEAVEAAGYPVRHITSGAGHDAMILAPHLPTAMLFLRSPDGVSHHPDESVYVEDVAAALEVGLRFVQRV